MCGEKDDSKQEESEDAISSTEEIGYSWTGRDVSGTEIRAECVLGWLRSPDGSSVVLSGRLKSSQMTAMAEIGDDFDLSIWDIVKGLIETFLERKHLEYSQPRRDIPWRARNLLRGMEKAGLVEIQDGNIEDLQEAVIFSIFDEFLNNPEILDYAVAEAKRYWTIVHAIAVGQTEPSGRFAEGVDVRKFLRLNLEDFGWMLMLRRSSNKTVNWRRELYDWKPRTPEKQRYVLMIFEQIRDFESGGWDFLCEKCDIKISVSDVSQRISLGENGLLKKPYKVEKGTSNHRKSPHKDSSEQK